MSVPTYAATRMYLGGEEKELAFDKFPYSGLVKTYCVDRQVPDSACTATAYLNGVKANFLTIGVDSNVKAGDCESGVNAAYHTKSIAKWAQDAGKATGLVTTTRVTHASPSGVYANIADRMWESDTDVKAACPNTQVPDIAYQLINHDVGRNLKVILGGGRRMFINQTTIDEEGKPGRRSDGRNLINEWQNRTGRRQYVWNRNGLLNVDAKKTDYLLGLVDSDNFPFHVQSIAEGTTDKTPTLAEMTAKAIDVLSKNDKGFFLFVEGGEIDFGHHYTLARAAFDETAEFSKAIQVAREKLSDNDTLIVVSSDHSHTMSYSGYPERGNDILGVAGVAGDGLPYMTINYANGPAYKTFIDSTGKRANVDKLDRSPWSFMYPASIPVDSETHGGDDVGVFASGPYAHYFSGVFEQSYIPHLMGYAACIGNGPKACDKKPK